MATLSGIITPTNVETASSTSTLTNKTINGASNTITNVSLSTGVTGTLPVANGGTGTTSTTFANLTTNVTGTLPVANGGTGAATLTANNVLLGNGTSALQAVAPGASGNVLTSNGTTWASTAPAVPSPIIKTWTSFTATGSYTVPAGVTSIRVYAIGAGSNSAVALNSQTQKTRIAGSGGGMAYGDIAVTPGQTVSINISSGVATVSISGTTLLTANKGQESVFNSETYQVTQGLGGTATKHVSVTNGGAYSGGLGGTNYNGGGGASAGSPLGTGVNATSDQTSGGRSPIGAHGGAVTGGSGFVNNALPTTTRGLTNAYTDPLLANATGPGGSFLLSTYGSANYVLSVPPSNGGGSAGVASRTGANALSAADFGGGGAAWSDVINGPGGGISGQTYMSSVAGSGGLLSGGGSCVMNLAANFNSSPTGQGYAGNGGYGGGGGGGYVFAYNYQDGTGYAYLSNGTGGPALVLIYA